MLLIVFLIIGFRYTIPGSRIDIEDITDTLSSEESTSESLSENDVAFRKPISSDRVSENKKRNFADYKKRRIINNMTDVKLSSFKNSEHSVNQKPGVHFRQQKSKIDINTGDSATFEKLYGIGPVLSARIIKYRRLLGGYASIEQLKEVYGLSAETYEAIREKIFADSTVITRININSAGYKELAHFPYFEKYEISAILKYREIKGTIKSIDDLIDNKLITAEKAIKVQPYLKYEE